MIGGFSGADIVSIPGAATDDNIYALVGFDLGGLNLAGLDSAIFL